MAWITRKQAAVAGGGLSAGALALAGIFIPHWEGMDLTVRQQSFDPTGVYTVCNGITNLDSDYKWIKPGMKFTPEQCSIAFKKVLPKYYKPLAACIPTYYDMPPHRQVALLSAAYNLGPGRICKDFKINGKAYNIAREFNAGRTESGCKLLGQFVSANGKVLKGLQNRRFDPKWGEIAWCLRKD